MNRIQKVLSFTMIIILAASLFVGCAPKDKLVATVNGENITKTEFDKTFNQFKLQYEQQYGPEVWENDVEGRKFIDVAKEKILEVEIALRLEGKKAAELGLTVTDEELKAELEKAKTYFGDEAKFNEFLTSQQMTLESLNDTMKKQMISTKLQEKINENTAITDQEVEAYYNDNKEQFKQAKASHILVKTKEEADAVKKRILAGEDFATVAKAVSTDPSAQQNGGDLSYFYYGDMVEPFSAAAFALKVGDVSEPVKSDYGFHIIKTVDFRIAPLEETKDSIQTNLLTSKQNEVYTKMMDELTKAATIKKYPENLVETK